MRWLRKKYESHPAFADLRDRTKEGYLYSIEHACNYILSTGRFAGKALGDIPVRLLTPKIVDAFYYEYRVVTDVDEDGTPVLRKRYRFAQAAVHTMKAMLNAMRRDYPEVVGSENPFVGLKAK
jgi:hypothetical protein